MNSAVMNLGAWSPVGSNAYAPNSNPFGMSPSSFGGGGGTVSQAGFTGQFARPGGLFPQSRYREHLAAWMTPGVGASPLSGVRSPFSWQQPTAQPDGAPFRNPAGPGGAPSRWPYLNSSPSSGGFSGPIMGGGGGQLNYFAGLPSMGGGWPANQSSQSFGGPLNY